MYQFPHFFLVFPYQYFGLAYLLLDSHDNCLLNIHFIYVWSVLFAFGIQTLFIYNHFHPEMLLSWHTKSLSSQTLHRKMHYCISYCTEKSQMLHKEILIFIFLVMQQGIFSYISRLMLEALPGQLGS